MKLYQKFPDVQVLTTKGVIDFYKDIFGKGKWLFLFAHPADFTSDFLFINLNVLKFQDS